MWIITTTYQGDYLFFIPKFDKAVLKIYHI